MDIVENIVRYFRKAKKGEKEESPEGVCSLCWGRQEYDHKIRTLFEDKQVDVNNHKDRYMLVQYFVKKNLDGIKLRNGKTETCPTCGGEHAR